MRPALLHAVHESIYKSVVLFAPNPMMLPSDVKRILEPFFVVGSHIKLHRKTMLRMNAAERGIKGHLPDGDAHSSRTLIAESEDSFTIANHDAFHVVVMGMNQNLIDAIFIRIAEEQSSWL